MQTHRNVPYPGSFGIPHGPIQSRHRRNRSTAFPLKGTGDSMPAYTLQIRGASENPKDSSPAPVFRPIP